MHTIRLRGPWQLLLADCTDSKSFDWTRHWLPTWEQVRSAVASSDVQMLRIFNAPTGIEENDCLELVICGLPGCDVLVNDQLLCSACAAEQRLAILPHLQPRNQLRIVWRAGANLPPADASALPLVRLEITPAHRDHS